MAAAKAGHPSAPFADDLGELGRTGGIRTDTGFSPGRSTIAAVDADPLQNSRIWMAMAMPTSARMAAMDSDVPRPREGFATPSLKART